MADTKIEAMRAPEDIKDDLDDDFPHVMENQYVLIHMPSGNLKLINLHADTTIQLGKFGSFQSNNLIGQPYGLSYEIYDKKGNIRPIKNFSLEAVEETKANNQSIQDTSKVQTLTHAQVEQMKQDSHSGELDSEDLIQRIVSSHAQFDQKTEYSKHKYIERKKKKFMKVFTPVRPTLYTITDFFFNKNPDKINYLRNDTLSQLLSRANVRANAKLLIFDDTQGLIVTAAAERMAGYGTIVAIHDNDNHNFDILRYLNLSKKIQNTIHTVPLARINPEDPQEVWTDKPQEQLDDMTEENRRVLERKKRSLEDRNRSRELLFEGNFDGVIISSYYDTKSIIEKLTPYLSGSRPIVVYSHAKEPLVPAAEYMRKSRDYIESDISESFLRRYQVLPGRTHPEMTMSAGGGYLLSAIRVIDTPDEFDDACIESKKRRIAAKAAKAEAANVNADADGDVDMAK
ncbi:Gcd10p family-domain-containing protein [Gongronella butleri]|nr:Gcd10p family-domain-containing protein [Gongronella butleri]